MEVNDGETKCLWTEVIITYHSGPASQFMYIVSWILYAVCIKVEWCILLTRSISGAESKSH